MRINSESAIDDLYASWSEAFRRADVDAIVELLTADYVLWAPGAAELDAEALRPRLKAAFAAYEITSVFECVERLIAGDLAVDRGWDVQRLRSRSNGEERINRQRVMLVLRRSPDGKWRFGRGMSQPGPSGAEV
jgi:ketosteroid isomerase-like protein